jgi:myo-inositol-1(or 4)-monophosphatase
MKETLIKALKEAGKELLNNFGTNHEFTVKESQSSIVTKIDIKNDALIREIIMDAFPEHNIVAEESGFMNNNSRYTWVVDPLDGTSNFAAGIPWFGVLIALFDGNTPVMGGAYLPVGDHLYFAERGKGTTVNGDRVTMKKTLLRNSLISFNVDFVEDEAVLNSSLDIYKRLVKSARNIRCTNCLMDFLYTAEGKFGGVINLFTRVWDIAPLGLIIEEAGGEMIYTNGNKITYHFDDNISKVNYPVVAGTKGIIDELRKNVL